MSKWSKVTSYGVKTGWKLMYDGQRLDNGRIHISHIDYTQSNNIAICFENKDDNVVCMFNDYKDIISFIEIINKNEDNYGFVK